MPVAFAYGVRPAQGISWALIAALLTLVPGAIGLLSGQLLLFPSLAPTALMLAHSSGHEHSRFQNIVVAHIGGMCVAYAVVWTFGLAGAPSVFVTRQLVTSRVAASVVAIFLATIVELALNATHPPAAATTLLVALGSFKAQWRDAAWIVAGVVIVALCGELRRVRS